LKKHLTFKCNYPLMAGALVLAGLGSLLLAANRENPPHSPARHAQTSHVAQRAASTTPTGHTGGTAVSASDAAKKTASRRAFAEFYQHQAAARQSRLAQMALAEPAPAQPKAAEDQAPAPSPPSPQAAGSEGGSDGVKYQPLAALPGAAAEPDL